jgi:hypothetical protein
VCDASLHSIEISLHGEIYKLLGRSIIESPVCHFTVLQDKREVLKTKFMFAYKRPFDIKLISVVFIFSYVLDLLIEFNLTHF